jgi:hypothetical protein
VGCSNRSGNDCEGDSLNPPKEGGDVRIMESFRFVIIMKMMFKVSLHNR